MGMPLSTPEGRPYFVMEFVPGIAITRYCDKHELTLQQRLELFMDVLRGRTTRRSEGDHSSRPQTFEYFGSRARQQFGSQNYRFWSGQGDCDISAIVGPNDVHAGWRC